MTQTQEKPKLIILKMGGKVLTLRNKVGNHFLPESAETISAKKPGSDFSIYDLQSSILVGNTEEWFRPDKNIFSKRDYFVDLSSNYPNFNQGENLVIWLDINVARTRVGSEDSAALRELEEILKN